MQYQNFCKESKPLRNHAHRILLQLLAEIYCFHPNLPKYQWLLLRKACSKVATSPAQSHERLAPKKQLDTCNNAQWCHMFLKGKGFLMLKMQEQRYAQNLPVADYRNVTPSRSLTEIGVLVYYAWIRFSQLIRRTLGVKFVKSFSFA